MIPMVDLRAQYASIKEEVDAAVLDVLASGQFALGPQVSAFEEEFAAYSGARYGVAVNSGTSALHLAAYAVHEGNVQDKPLDLRDFGGHVRRVSITPAVRRR